VKKKVMKLLLELLKDSKRVDACRFSCANHLESFVLNFASTVNAIVVIMKNGR